MIDGHDLAERRDEGTFPDEAQDLIDDLDDMLRITPTTTEIVKPGDAAFAPSPRPRVVAVIDDASATDSTRTSRR
jgi:hypothetical protein